MSGANFAIFKYLYKPKKFRRNFLGVLKMEDIMVICKKCGNKAPASSMKLDFDEKLMICSECIKNKKIHKEIKEEIFHKQENKPIEEAIQTKIVHKCISCGYKFKIDSETKTTRNCPYCSARVLSF